MCAGRQDLVRGSSAFVARPAPALFADFCHAEVLAGLPAGVRAPLHGAVTAVAHLPAGQLAGVRARGQPACAAARGARRAAAGEHRCADRAGAAGALAHACLNAAQRSGFMSSGEGVRCCSKYIPSACQRLSQGRHPGWHEQAAMMWGRATHRA